MDLYLNYNGKLVRAAEPVISADNRGFRYGDGLFETMKVKGDNILLKKYHTERLFSGLAMMQLEIPALFTEKYIEEQVLKTCKKNKIAELARVRLTIFRGDGGLYELTGKGGGFLIQAWPLSESAADINENGLVIGLYNGACKSCDPFSNLKSNNFLIYVMGALHARQQQYNECLLLNMHHRVCDATVANVFWVKEGRIFTPPLSEGCVAGVQRRNLIEHSTIGGYSIQEKNAELDEIAQADELFLTNAISGIRWVKRFGDKLYERKISLELYNKFIGR